MPIPQRLVHRALAIVLMTAAPGFAVAADIVVFSSPTLKTSLEEIAPRFAQASGHRLLVRYDSVAALKRRIEAAEPFDVALLLKDTVDALVAQGRLDPASAALLARAAVGVAVRAGAQLPDVSTVEALKATLTGAASYAYGSDSASGSYFVRLLERLEIPDAASKLRPVAGGKVMDAVARGEADLTVITVPNIIGEPGVVLAGLLPEALQNYTVFSAAASAASAASADLRAPRSALLEFLATPDSTQTFARHGLERARP